MREPDPTQFLPLREPTFLILLSLVPGEKHGYAILKDVESLSAGKVNLSTGTLYEALARLLDLGWIEQIEQDAGQGEANAGEGDHPGKPRKVYRLTRFGQRVAVAETKRLESLVTAARVRMEGRWAEHSGS